MISELKKISLDTGLPLPGSADSLLPKLYRPLLNPSILALLDKATVVYRYRYNKAVAERDAVYTRLVSEMKGQDELMRFRRDYFNKQLASVVTNENEIRSFTLHHGEMIPVKDAIYRDPSGNTWRAHFYSPVKNFFNQKVDTYWFDLSVMWLFSGLLFVLLYYNVIRRLLTYAETLRLNRINRLRINRLLKIAEQSRPVHKLSSTNLDNMEKR
jgi:hypothetical protein